MNATPARAGGELARRLAFFKGLQVLTMRVHGAEKLDDILFGIADDACALFGGTRMTVYMVDESHAWLTARSRTGRSWRVAVAPRGVVGACAVSRRTLNVADARAAEELGETIEGWHAEDDAEPGASPLQQVLVAPLVGAEDDALLGVLLMANTRDHQPFSDIEQEGIHGLAQSIAEALSHHTHATTVPLHNKFDALVVSGRLARGDLEAAAGLARERRQNIEQVLRDQFGCSDAELGASMAQFYSVPYEPFRADRVRPLELLRNIKREYASKSLWLPLEETSEGIVIVAVDPEQTAASRVAQNVFMGARIAYRVTTLREFGQAVAQFFDTTADDLDVGDLLSGMEDDEGVAPADELSAAADNELVKLVNRIILDAHRQGASDIHVEPRAGKEKTLIRFRKDGVLVPYIEVPAAYRSSLVARIKIMCDLDISERRKPQDGKIKFRKYGPLDLELRVATIPTASGFEDIVMRLLAHGEPLSLEALALSPHTLTRLKETISKPYGIFFVCGPTGSGKTTTLHSVLKYLNTSETKIWTAEDPVEISQRGLRQVQVNRKAGLTFATVMRSFLRADPDIIMVGEMRDAETVAIGIEASLTGHLVLSTLHTNSAPESVVRLLDMGMDPFNFADALLGVLAQRLARKLCSHCREAVPASEEDIQRLLGEYCEDLRKTPSYVRDPEAARARILDDWRSRFGDAQGRLSLHRAVGCPECSQTGYRGRIGLHELMLGSEEVRRHVQQRSPAAELFVVAQEEGMRTLRQDGIEKVWGGFTDMVQVRKVCLR
ncbi:MAG: ATPase, T2SS/T4P/T4SS family [Rhodocyclaceae bacterium]